VKHPNCLQCLDIFSSNNNCYIVTELCNEGDLESRVIRARGKLEESQCRNIICDVYQGLLYLAEQHIVHRDIKVANIFIKEGVAKIADFGFAKRTT
jgi:serine/threonine protein kinase